MDLHSFSIHELAWSAAPVNTEMFLQIEPLGTGGFRKAFGATSSTLDSLIQVGCQEVFRESSSGNK